MQSVTRRAMTEVTPAQPENLEKTVNTGRWHRGSEKCSEVQQGERHHSEWVTHVSLLCGALHAPRLPLQVAEVAQI